MLGGISLGVILFYFVLWQPLREDTAQLAGDVEERQALLDWSHGAVSQIRALGGVEQMIDSEDPEQALFALADSHAREAGLGDVLQRVEPSGEGGARIVFEQIAFDELVDWIGALQSRYGIRVGQLSLQQSDLGGRVDAQLMLEPGGA
nr:type II secretion system protein GspM [Methylonatrum kenyense]